MKQIAGQGHTHTNNYTSCLQDRMKQIAGQGHTHTLTITQPCLQDRMKQIAGQGYTHTNNYTTLPTRPHEAEC